MREGLLSPASTVLLLLTTKLISRKDRNEVSIARSELWNPFDHSKGLSSRPHSYPLGVLLSAKTANLV